MDWLSLKKELQRFVRTWLRTSVLLALLNASVERLKLGKHISLTFHLLHGKALSVSRQQILYWFNHMQNIEEELGCKVGYRAGRIAGLLKTLSFSVKYRLDGDYQGSNWDGDRSEKDFLFPHDELQRVAVCSVVFSHIKTTSQLLLFSCDAVLLWTSRNALWMKT